METFSVLVIDDDQDACNFVQTAFKEINFSITIAQNGFLAINAMKKQKFDLIFLDMKMPYMDGGAFLSKTEGILEVDKVIMLTGDSSKDTVTRVQQIGISNYLLKPVSIGSIRDKAFQILKVNEKSLLNREDLKPGLFFEKDFALKKMTITLEGIPNEVFPNRVFNDVKSALSSFKFHRIHLNVKEEYRFAPNGVRILEKIIKFIAAATGVQLKNIGVSGKYIKSLDEDTIKVSKILSDCTIEK